VRTSVALALISFIAFTGSTLRPSELSGQAAPLGGWYAGAVTTPAGGPGRQSEPPTPTPDSTLPPNLYSAAAAAGWRAAGRGALWGALVGASIGLVGCASDSECRDEGIAGYVYTALFVAAPGALLGATIGAILGVDDPVEQNVLPAIQFGVTRQGALSIGARLHR
jgi:hypothetical protein